MNSLISMTSKTAKSCSKTCRTKNIQDKYEIIATDLTYLLRTWDAKQNHLYLSVQSVTKLKKY